MREQLRQATGAIHARLDDMFGEAPVSNDGGYATFLSAQYSARKTVGNALDRQPPEGLGAPPAQIDLLLSDLYDLGVKPCSTQSSFRLDSPAEALGAAWVMAGSALGNRTMLSRRRKAGLHDAERFLSDTRLTTYFSELLGVLHAERDHAEVDEAIEGALRTFAIFESAFATEAVGAAA